MGVQGVKKYAEISNYQDPGFYQTCDFGAQDFDWNHVRWNMVPEYRLIEIPADKMVYSKLNPNQMSYLWRKPDADNERKYLELSSYQDPGFYQDCDFKNRRFDWHNIRWDMIPIYRIPNIPADKLASHRLDTEQTLIKQLVAVFSITSTEEERFLSYKKEFFSLKKRILHYAKNIREINGITITDISRLNNLLSSLKMLSPRLRNSIEEIELVEYNEIPKKCNSKYAGACCSGQKIIIPKNATLEDIAHEAAHALRYRIALEEKSEKNNFEFKWRLVAGDVYGKDLKPREGGLADEWRDSSEEGPKNGCVGPYGANNLGEDIATFVEKAYVNPDLFKPLIDPGKRGYDPRYLEKLELLLEYGFITQKLFDRIVK